MTADLQQGSPEWFRARLGCASASRFGDILATTKSGPAASRQNYLTQLVLERLTGRVADSYTTPAMERGTECEPRARAAFEAHTGLLVEEVGFIKRGEWLGCSPDGFCGEEEGLEIKVPQSATHLETLLAGAMPAKHLPQVMGSMLVTGRKRWHFVSWDDRFPPPMQLFHTVVERDEAYLVKLELAIELFLTDVANAVEKLQSLRKAA